MVKLRILIANEEAVSRNVLKSMLLYWGCEVIAVQDGKQACSALQAGNVDLCILNWNTAKLNGVEVCRWIRQAELKKTPYTILLADDPTAEEIREAYLAGANDFLNTPLGLEEVRTRVSKLASRIAHMRFMDEELGRMDPLECYRLDLALHGNAHSRA